MKNIVTYMGRCEMEESSIQLILEEISNTKDMCLMFVAIYGVGSLADNNAASTVSRVAGRAAKSCGIFGTILYFACMVLLVFLLMVEKMAAVIMNIWR